MLEGRSLMEPQRVIGPPSAYDFAITTYGFEQFAEAGIPNCETIVTSIARVLAQEVSPTKGQYSNAIASEDGQTVFLVSWNTFLKCWQAPASSSSTAYTRVTFTYIRYHRGFGGDWKATDKLAACLTLAAFAFENREPQMLVPKTNRKFSTSPGECIHAAGHSSGLTPGETRDESKARANDLAVTARVDGLGATVVDSKDGEL